MRIVLSLSSPICPFLYVHNSNTKEQVQKIAETKMPDLNAASLEAAMSMIAGTARSMGIVVED